jgi:hypothetical protein
MHSVFASKETCESAQGQSLPAIQITVSCALANSNYRMHGLANSHST